jgi:hypothetical protein
MKHTCPCDSQQERNGLCRWELVASSAKFLIVVIRQKTKLNLYLISCFDLCI